MRMSTHQYDVWHLKAVMQLLLCIQSVFNHLWRCAGTCQKSADILRGKWLFLLHHITCKHRGRASKEFKLIKRYGYPRISKTYQNENILVENGSPDLIVLVN